MESLVLTKFPDRRLPEEEIDPSTGSILHATEHNPIRDMCG